MTFNIFILLSILIYSAISPLYAMENTKEETEFQKDNNKLLFPAVNLEESEVNLDILAAKQEFSIFEKNGWSMERTLDNVTSTYTPPITDLKELLSRLSLAYPHGIIPIKEFALKKMRRGYTTIDLVTKLEIDPPVSLTLSTLEETFNNPNPCMERILSEMQPGSMVLEIGCSYGINTFQLAKHGIKVVANDTDANVLSDFLNFSSYRCYNDNVSISYGKFPQETPLPCDYFDAVTMYHIIHHMNPYEIRDCFKEIHKILRPGGKVYITSPTPYSSDYFWSTYTSLQRHKKKKKWPGEIKDRRGMWSKITGHPQEFFPSPTQPNYSHPQFPSILRREAERSGMIVLENDYYPYNSEKLRNTLPQNLDLEGVTSYREGKEGAYIIAQKPIIFQ